MENALDSSGLTRQALECSCDKNERIGTLFDMPVESLAKYEFVFLMVVEPFEQQSDASVEGVISRERVAST
jgi:hypothetical protein